MKFPHFHFQLACAVVVSLLIPREVPWWHWVVLMLAMSGYGISNWIEGREGR